MGRKHCNIPLFIPHMGCPHRCVFCNQNTISGCASFDPDTVPDRIRAALEGAEIVLHNNGVIELNGLVFINGVPYLPLGG